MLILYYNRYFVKSTFVNYFVCALKYAVFWHAAAHKGRRIDDGVCAYKRSRRKHAVAADFRTVAEHLAELFQAGVRFLPAARYKNAAFIGFDIG